MNIAIIGYLPPKTFGYPEAFLQNIKAFKTRFPLILFTDCDEWVDESPIRIQGNMEAVKGRAYPGPYSKPNKWAVNNLIFFTAVRIAMAHKITHFLYLEIDCRVRGDYWDEVVFGEYFEKPNAYVMGGSMVCYNPCNSGEESHRRYSELVARQTREGQPMIAVWGAGGAAHLGDTAIFVNGALGIYDVEWIKKLFAPDPEDKEAPSIENTVGLASAVFAWDFEMGLRMWKLFGVDVYDALAHLTTIFSAYEEIYTKEPFRIKLLKEGKVCAVHQVKSNDPVL